MVPIKELQSKEIQEFILKNRKSAVSELMLKMPSFGIDKKWVAAQIEGVQKALLKLPKWAETEHIIFPIRLSMEQCSSERTGIFKSSLLKGNCAVDLTGGFGVDAYYLAHSFNHVFYIEQQEELAQIAAHNFSTLNQENITVLVGNSDVLLKSIPEPIDVIYLDPARRKETQKVFKLSDCEPNVIENQDFYFRLSNTILIKTSPMLDISEAMRQLKGVKKIYIVSVDNECKEVLYQLEKNFSSEPDFYCIHDYKKSIQSFSFNQSLENSFKAPLSNPLKFIYEPNPSVLKAGGFNAIANTYKVFKLHASSHLYSSDVYIKDFPGRVFILTNQIGYSKKEVQAHIPEGKANIQVRNFPDSVENIRKKTGLKDGGNIFIFATTLQDSSKTLLICEKYVSA
ncbi:SAM-dependent methyltransferase [uncultured Cytophaga sp.]|uniref:class I SAM-dependent methyltransferase n=1 Tax=uncultured Cytophaga sp. TaxID=160238 RepID=UPI0026148E07|nr:SAM-dependent methyltransferase [uncultured Cytophaga sp.]